MATLSERLEGEISAIVNGGFLDPLDDSAVAAMARRLDAFCQFRTLAELGSDFFRVTFSDGSDSVFDRLDSSPLPADPLRIAMPLRD